MNTSLIPAEGDSVQTSSYGNIPLRAKISSGGEGCIYAIDKKHVCKIYYREKLSSLKQQKLEWMVRQNITKQGICWPKDIVYNRRGEFVGFLMERAEGKPMQVAMFIKPLLQKNFSYWTRNHLVELAITVLEKIQYLHENKIIMGDINPLNILIKNEKEVFFVDTDSYQVGRFPCPVGTVHFTPPELQGKNYGEFLRTPEHEYFAVATLVFMILLPGKPPYSHQGGESPAENIRNKDFSYPFGNHSTKKAPDGPWRFIWSNLPYKIKQAFYAAFHEDQRIPTEAWLKLMQYYRYLLAQNYTTDVIFPNHFKIVDPMTARCSKCGQEEVVNKDWVQKLNTQGKQYLCQDCRERINLEKLSKQKPNKAEPRVERGSLDWLLGLFGKP